jgi:uncharacterized protein (TIGR03435 family)
MKAWRLAALFAATLGLAQTPPIGATPKFEVASVKPRGHAGIEASTPERMAGGLPVMKGGPGTGDPGRIRYSYVNLMALIMKAYDFETDQIFGPGWIIEERYDVDAVIHAGASEDQFRQMLQNLLAERFKLSVQWEEREFQVYRLSVANGGPKLEASAVTVADDEDYDLIAKQALTAQAGLNSEGCPVLPRARRGTLTKQGCTTYVGYSMPELASQLARMVGNQTGSNFGPNRSWAHVVDATGLSGRFDFTLKYDAAYHAMINSPGIPSAMRDSARSSNPVSIFKAVEAQLGLKLEAAKGKLKVMVIQHVEKVPTAN